MHWHTYCSILLAMLPQDTTCQQGCGTKSMLVMDAAVSCPQNNRHAAQLHQIWQPYSHSLVRVDHQHQHACKCSAAAAVDGTYCSTHTLIVSKTLQQGSPTSHEMRDCGLLPAPILATHPICDTRCSTPNRTSVAPLYHTLASTIARVQPNHPTNWKSQQPCLTVPQQSPQRCLTAAAPSRHHPPLYPAAAAAAAAASVPDPQAAAALSHLDASA